MKKSEIEAYAQALVMPIIEAGGYELWDVEYVKEGQDYYLRIYADKEGGITIDELVEISRALEAKIDAEDKIEGAYILEVSSPGLTRPLKKNRDYERSIGKLVDIKLYKAIEGQKELTGTLEANTEEQISVSLEDGRNIDINKNEISMARLAFVE